MFKAIARTPDERSGATEVEYTLRPAFRLIRMADTRVYGSQISICMAGLMVYHQTKYKTLVPGVVHELRDSQNR